ncbi:hypothetical protein ECE50_004060 [Chitinophaga sp. Mgbs1]|uniref:Uncharacterized protein n=1 Tax=Chitinophaga solisilvae TaxID=1233460 RepID=A0A3S1AXC3_9BACT|nr:hypothetical protein [Chitinophaga solisilvae]
MLINNRFEVDLVRSKVTDRDTGDQTRLEPRLMKLLCLLIENHERLVTRPLIIKEVWDDYPGGEEGLNQAISGLRKLLHDEQKQLIETLPKKGYCFHGVLSDNIPAAKRKLFKPVYVAGILLLVILTVFTFLFYRTSRNSYTNQSSTEEHIRLFKIDSARQAEKLKK